MAEPRLSVEIDADASGATRGFDRAGDAAEDMAKRVKRAGRGAQVANDNFRKASRGSSSFGRAVQNASFQVGDFATQVGAGTSASIALGQQLPQLIGGFGVLGAALGAAVAIGVPLVRVLGEMETSAADLERVFGALTPAITTIGSALSGLKTVFQESVVFLINNLDRLIIVTGAAAAIFAGRWVASVTAARVAGSALFKGLMLVRNGFDAIVFGATAAGSAVTKLAGAFAVLKRALIASGFGIFAVAVGEAIYQLVTVNSELRKFLVGLDLISAKSVEELDDAIAGVQSRIETYTENLRRAEEAQGRAYDARRVEGHKNRLAEANEELAQLIEKREKLAELDANAPKPFTVKDIFGGGKAKSEGEGEGKTDADRTRDELAAKLQVLRDSFKTEKELLYEQLAEKNKILKEARELTIADEKADLLSHQEYLQAKADLHKQHADKIAAIEQAKRNAMLTQAANTFGALQSMAMSFGKKGAKVAQVFGLAKALISTFTGAAKALELPFPANIAAFAQVLATGMGAVASIKGVNTNGGGNSASGGGRGAAPVAAAPKPLEVMIQGLGANDLITGGQISSLFDKLVDEAGDRGIRPVFA